MDLHDWLDAESGRASKLAAALRRSKTAVSLWREAGVPLGLMPFIAEWTQGVVSEEEMLRHALRCRAKPAAAQQHLDAPPSDLAAAPAYAQELDADPTPGHPNKVAHPEASHAG
jgi:hypothetical protein